MIETRKLKELIKLMTENELCEIDLRDKDQQVTLRRGTPPQQPVVYAQPAAPAPLAAAPCTPAVAAAETPEVAAGPSITSPMVGTFYTASSPDAEPLVKVGQSVGPDTVVCIIEAMKVFNEIKAEQSGRVEKVLVTNGQAVEFGQPLFVLKPE